MPASHPQVWPLDKIIPYPNNPRTHPPEQIELLAKLITQHGVDQPIVVDEDGFILKGHGRRMAAMQAGLTSFPVVQHLGLSEDEKKAIRLSDNQVALLSGWDQNLLRMELTELQSTGYEMNLLGFSDIQLVTFMTKVPEGTDPEAVPETPKKPTTILGDVWIMGKHRLICGDSTKKEDVERVLNGQKPILMVTDPPYGVDYDPEWRAKVGGKALGKVKNDHRADWTEAWNLFPGDVTYVWHGALRSVEQAIGLESAGFQMRCQIIWNKGRIVIGRGDYHWQHEACWYAVRKGRAGRWTGSRTESSVWDIPKPQANETGHGTQKPVECMRRPMINNSTPGQYVYEPFCGSGTTIIAAEMTTRYCLAVELDPVYVDVAVQRWQEFAKQEAALEGDGRTFAEVAKARAKKKPAPGKSPRPAGRRAEDQAAAR